MSEHLEKIKQVTDVAAIGAGAGVFLGWINTAVGVLTIIYMAIRILEIAEKRHESKLWPFNRKQPKKNGDGGT